LALVFPQLAVCFGRDISLHASMFNHSEEDIAPLPRPSGET